MSTITGITVQKMLHFTGATIAMFGSNRATNGVLPDPDFMDITKAGTITVLLDYFRSCFEVISGCTSGKSQHLMFLALSDALGGYLRTYILPLTRQAYYAGEVKYVEAREIFQFYDEIRDFLKTNGVGWAKPRRIAMNCRARPLKITTRGCEAACCQLYITGEQKAEVCVCPAKSEEKVTEQIPAQAQTSQDLAKSSVPLPNNLTDATAVGKQKYGDIMRGFKYQKYAENNRYEDDDGQASPKIRLNGKNVQKIEKIRKNAKLLRDRLHWSTMHPPRYHYAGNISSGNMFRSLKKLKKRNICCQRKDPCCPTHEREMLMIPLPVLDDPGKPEAIGLPLRNRPLRSLDSPHAVCILVRYYILVVKCLMTRINGRADVCRFNADFHAWLSDYVLPHLSDEQWYPAFGGVLRIEETIKNIGSDECPSSQRSDSNDIGFMFSEGFTFDESDYLKNDECQEDESLTCCTVQHRTYLTLGIVGIVFLWTVAFCYCICCYCPSVKVDEPGKTVYTDNEKKTTSPSNSFIVQYFVKFFKRAAAAEENKKLAEEAIQDHDGSHDHQEGYFDDEDYDLEDYGGRELENRPSTPTLVNTRRPYMEPAEFRENTRRSGHQRETIVLPAQISPINNDLQLGLSSVWPFTDFRDNGELMKLYPKECLKSSLEKKESPTKRDRDQFKTIWKRELCVAQTSESCGELVRKNECGKSGKKGKKMKLEQKPCRRSSYSDNSNFDDENRKRVIFIRRSRSAFDYPGSYQYSYNSSENSYSSSQVGDDIPTELYDHIMACHNSFAKKPRQKSESESERDVTTTSSSASCLTPRKPQRKI